jgi:hypothetical protein
MDFPTLVAIATASICQPPDRTLSDGDFALLAEQQ